LSRWKRFLDIFRVHVTIHERTRIIHRAFPYKLEIQPIPKSIHERVATEQNVQLEKAVYLIDKTINVTLSNQTIQGIGPETAIRMVNES
jgi:hypothetical protein